MYGTTSKHNTITNAATRQQLCEPSPLSCGDGGGGTGGARSAGRGEGHVGSTLALEEVAETWTHVVGPTDCTQHRKYLDEPKDMNFPNEVGSVRKDGQERGDGINEWEGGDTNDVARPEHNRE
ncbi:hypothetical protein BD779DRAFT_1475921 [Infundibulicybe gibba]|nr:hypothetical protein BD779DRAFT_1475921 [Infundibulicybe gibba]